MTTQRLGGVPECSLCGALISVDFNFHVGFDFDLDFDFDLIAILILISKLKSTLKSWKYNLMERVAIQSALSPWRANRTINRVTDQVTNGKSN